MNTKTHEQKGMLSLAATHFLLVSFRDNSCPFVTLSFGATYLLSTTTVTLFSMITKSDIVPSGPKSGQLAWSARTELPPPAPFRHHGVMTVGSFSPGNSDVVQTFVNERGNFLRPEQLGPHVGVGDDEPVVSAAGMDGRPCLFDEPQRGVLKTSLRDCETDGNHADTFFNNNPGQRVVPTPQATPV